MTISVNSAKTGKQNLLDLLNAANPGRAFNSSNVSLGAPVAEVSGDNNTKVTVFAIEDQTYGGSQTVNYIRLNPGEAHGLDSSFKVVVLPTDTDEEIRQKIIVATGIIGDDVTIEGSGVDGAFVLPVNEDDESCTFTVTANEDSYVYFGNFTAVLSVPDTDIPLEDAIEVFKLSGFTEEISES